MTLKTLFVLPIAAILLVTLSLAGMLAGQEISGHSRGKAAIAAVERMRLLVLLKTDLWAERINASRALSHPFPIPAPVYLGLAAARKETDLHIAALIEHGRTNKGSSLADNPYIFEVLVKLGGGRATVDALLARDRPDRSLAALGTVVPRLLAVAFTLNRPLVLAATDVAQADPGLSGLLTALRLTAYLQETISQIAGVVIPRYIRRERLSAVEDAEIVGLFARARQLFELLESVAEINGAAGRVAMFLRELPRIEDDNPHRKLSELMDQSPAEAAEPVVDASGMLPPQRIIMPWNERASALSVAIVDEAMERVTQAQDVRARRLIGVMTAVVAVIIAILASLALLRWKVVGPLAQLGLAITRIAAGDRGTALLLKCGTREIEEMVTAVETLRQAALVADATASRRREAARQRLHALREALGIAQTVQEPARALDRGILRLSEGIEAAIVLATTPTSSPPPTLNTAANALRLGLAEMRGSAADLEVTIAAARAVQLDDMPESEIVAHILAMQAHVDRRDAAVRGFIQPSLLALRDAASVDMDASRTALRDLITEQFQRIETTVAIVAAMRAAVSRSAAILRDLPLDSTPAAA